MGAGASTGPLTEREEKFFAEMQKAYDEYKPQHAKMVERKDSYRFFKTRIDDFLENEKHQAKLDGRDEDLSDLTSKIDDYFESRAEAKNNVKQNSFDSKHSPLEVSSETSNKSLSVPKRFNNPTFYVGDIVKAKVDGLMFEGVVVHNGENNSTIDVDFGDDIETVKISDCSLIMSGLDFEVGDLVQARTTDSYVYCHGKILNINHDGTFDIVFDGDDDDDVERNIPHSFVRKHRTGREMVKKRWDRARAVLSTIRAFKELESKDTHD